MNINQCILLFSIVLCILLFYKLSQKETFQVPSSSSSGASTSSSASEPTETSSSGASTSSSASEPTETSSSGIQNGETMCERRGYNEQQCAAVGCCQWDADFVNPETGSRGECMSNVGDGPCVASSNNSSETNQGESNANATNQGGSNIQYRYRPTSWVNETDYENIKNRFINDLTSTRPVTTDDRTLSELIQNSLQSEEIDINSTVNDLNNSIRNIEQLNRSSSGFLNNIDHLGKFQDNYSKKLQSILESKYQGTINNSFNLKQKIAEQKIKSIQDILSGLEQGVVSENESAVTLSVFKSIRCIDNDLSLNVEGVVQNNILSKDGFYMIYMNDNILFYELTNIAGTTQQCTNRIRNLCDYRCTDGSDNNLQFDTTYNDNLSDAYFKIIIINNHDEYNLHINSHNENSLKRFAYETDDISYPFYIIQPKNHPGKCLNFEVGELGEFKVRVKPCSNTKTERFEAMIYESTFGCAPEDTS